MKTTASFRNNQEKHRWRSAASQPSSTASRALWYGYLLLSVLASSSSKIAEAMEAELEFNYLPIAHVRTDPIISDVCLSDHVHTFYGPPLVAPSVTTRDLVESDPAQHSGLVEENKSLYWHPSIYRVSPSDGIFTLEEIHYTSIYYFWDPLHEEETTYAFPEGFRMIAADRAAFVECVVGDFKPCAREDGCGVPEGLPLASFFPPQACDMLEITMDFPSCWDGRLDSPNHRDHVKHPNDNDDDACPGSHPRRIPTLSISIYIKDYDGGYHTWSDLTNEFHTDYLSGWDEGVMETFLEGCAVDTDNCDRFLTWKPGTSPTGCDTHDEKREKLLRVVPDPLPDTRATIADEAVTNVTLEELPRGLCVGSLVQATTPGPTGSEPPPPSERPTGRRTSKASKKKAAKKKKQNKKQRPRARIVRQRREAEEDSTEQRRQIRTD